MELSRQQQIAYDQIGEFLKSSDRVYTLAGYAGTGKTTIANQIAEMSGLPTLFCAFTGKAALALRKKGCPAETIHSLLYQPLNKSRSKLFELEERLTKETDEKIKNDLQFLIAEERKRISLPGFSFNPREELKKAGLVIVDEYSMLTNQLYNDLLSGTRAKFLFLGDPGQLPAIGTKLIIQPDYFLEEVHRQALDSSVLRAATYIRTQGRLPTDIDDEEFCIRDKEQCDWRDYNGADQVIVGHNATRKTFNRKFREKLNMRHIERFGLPVKGDKLICLRNNSRLGIYNGTIGYCTQDTTTTHYEDDVGIITFSEDKEKEGFPISIYLPRILEDKIPDYQDAKDRAYEDFDYGYAITCHKSQGSEWDNVLVYHEGFGRGAEEKKQWLYTAVTRASKSCKIVRAK